MDARVTFKTLLLVYKILKGLSSQDFGLRYKGFNGRPDDYLILQTPVFKTAYGKRVLAYHGSRLWNALPTNVRAEDDVEKFKKSIKTLLAGTLGAVAVYWSQLESLEFPWISTVGEVLSAISIFLIGLWARDNNKSSEDIGLK